MTQETYENVLKTLKMQEELIREERKLARESYLEANKPCELNDVVEIKTKVTTYIGEAKSFAIFQDGKVYVSSVKVGGSTKYISTPYLSIEKK